MLTTISALIAAREATKPTAPKRVNPFPGLDFINLNEKFEYLKGSKIHQVLESIAEHMDYYNLPAASILCSGQLKNSYRHFVNLHAAKQTVPQLEDIRGLTHLIHFESKNYPHIIVLKFGAIKAEMN